MYRVYKMRPVKPVTRESVERTKFYTQADIEQARMEAFNDGWNEGFAEGREEGLMNCQHR